jgi:hypothetical protein
MRRIRRVLTVAAVTATIGGTVALTPGSASAATTLVVRPGQSIQAAVNRAHAGDTILIKPGVYRQSVLVTKSHLRIRGSGNTARGTVLMPGNPKANECAKNASGFCVVGLGKARVTDVTIDDLRTVGYGDSGVIAFHAANLNVYNVVANHNGGYGIARFDTTGGQLLNNTTIDNDEAGLYIGDSPNADVFVAANRTSQNGFGILYRHSRNAQFAVNNVHDNCIGIFMVSAPPKPPTGGAFVGGNTVWRNNKFCKGNPEEVPFNYSGAGIVLLGATGVVIENNAVLSNRGSTLVSGGIVLLNGAAVGAGPSTNNIVRNNTAYRDAPADIVNHSGGSNTFRNNFCTRSIPGGLCRH